MPPRLRSSEWVLVVYFWYVAGVSLFFPLTTGLKFPAFALAAVVSVLVLGLARLEQRTPAQTFSMVRDWLPLPLTLLAYREMNWFTKPHTGHPFEHAWIIWDRRFLNAWGMQKLIESAGWLVPAYLELCYLLVYAVGPITVAILYLYHRRDLVDRILFVYVLGTLLAYGLFPYFPSDPPRVVFAGLDLPHVSTLFRRMNLAIVGGVGIHSSVFPSAHVSSAFSAGWGLLAFLPGRRNIGVLMLIYAASVAVATVYGRYHYAVDAVAGTVVSVSALLVAITLARRSERREANVKLKP